MSIIIPIITEYINEIEQSIISEYSTSLNENAGEFLADNDNNFMTYGA
jgi:hypothetical protein